MRDFADNCIVLKIRDYRDDDRLADVLTAQNGVAAVLFRGVKKAKAKLKPFAQAFAVFNARFTSARGAFLTPVDPSLIQDGFGLAVDLKAFTAASVCAEATSAALYEESPHPEVFVEFLKFIKSAQFDGDPYYAAATYMCRLLRLSGFYREYPYAEKPNTPQQMLGYCQKHGYGKSYDGDMARRALKYICSEFSRNFDVGLNSAQSIDLYN